MLKKPPWLRVKYSHSMKAVEDIINKHSLNTVCIEAKCPNCSECFSKKTATFMILGTQCTRSCRFCNINNGIPQPVDPNEPEKIANGIIELGLKYVVITSVTRDDLLDGGAAHFANVIRRINEKAPNTTVEVLIPDFGGNINLLELVIDASPQVISHNIETVADFYSLARPQACYQRSLTLLKNIKTLNDKIKTKTGIMLGLSETKAQIITTLNDLKAVECNYLTLGQYLAPSSKHLPVSEYIKPEQFDEYKIIAEKMGFEYVASAPFVRSSYNASAAII